MLSTLRNGFGRDLALLLLCTVVAGSLIAGVLSVAVDRYFAGTTRALIGDYGEYDVIVHVRQEAKSAALEALRDLLREKLPKARLKEGIALAGQANYLVAVPESGKSRAVYEKLPQWLGSLPGYTGLTFITEPSVIVSNTHPGVRDELRRQLESIPGVRFVFRDGNRLIAVLGEATDAEAVFAAAEQAARRYRVLEVRFPFGQAVADPAETAARLQEALEHMWGAGAARDVTLLGQDAETSGFVAALGEMKRFLLGYATQVEVTLTQPGSVVVGDTLVVGEPEESDTTVLVRVSEVSLTTAKGYVEEGDSEPFLAAGGEARRSGADGTPVGKAVFRNERLQLIAAIDDSLALLGQLDELTEHAEGAVAGAEETLATFEAALVQLEALQEQVEQINQELTTRGSVDVGQVLVSALLSTLLERVQPQGESAPAVSDADVPGMRQQLQGLAEQLQAVSQVDVSLIETEIKRVRENLPRLTDSEIGSSLQLIERYLEGQVVPGDRLQLLVKPGVELSQSEALVKTVVGNDRVALFSSPAAVVTPNPQATLFSVLGQIRQVIAGIGALGLLIVVLLLDHATLFDAFRLLGWRRRGGSAALCGAVLLVGMYVGSRAALPGLSLVHVALIGALLGFAVHKLAHRLSPVNGDEVEAGLAMGLSQTQVLREIIIPAGRPGLMMLLNRRKQAFQ